MKSQKIENKVNSLGGMLTPAFLLKVKQPNFDVNLFEIKHQKQLPSIYKWFSEKYGFSNFCQDVLFYSINQLPISNNHYSTIGIFFGWGSSEYSLVSVNKNKYGQIPDNLFAIAEGAAGDFICIEINNNKQNKIYYWHHESPIGKDLFLVSENFEDFILNIEKSKSSDNKNLGIEEEWVSDDF
jgi:SMI1-KNR4 cell-wall